MNPSRLLCEDERPEAFPRLEANDLLVWKASIAPSEGRVAHAAPLLSSEEMVRSGGYADEGRRQRFILRRAMLRRLLSLYTDTPPRRLEIRQDRLGKLTLLGSHLEFSVSHAADVVMFALSPSGRVGIDVERTHTAFDTRRIERRFFSPQEREILARLSGADRTLAWFRCWTRKEAYVKALGEGISARFRHVSVPILAADSPIPIDAGAGSQWLIENLSAPPGHVAAIAYEGCEARRVRVLTLAPGAGPHPNLTQGEAE
jgi:4'-phosphopantetheinyl transferase